MAAEALSGTRERGEKLAQCLEQARGGDLTALDSVVAQLNPLLWQVARAEGLPAEDALDVVQTAWLELLRRLHEIRSPGALTAWLVRTTRREAWRVHARLRKRCGPDSAVLETLPDLAPDLADRAGQDEQERALWRHFRLLPDRCRALLRVIAFTDRPNYTEIADAMAMPRGSIGPTRGRCLAKLREMLLEDPTWSPR